MQGLTVTSFRHSLAFFVLLALSGQSLAQQDIHHLVLIWLKPDITVAQRDTMIDKSQALADIPGVSGFRIGPVVPSDRAVVDDSFDVAITMVFPDRQTLETYIESDAHKQIVSEHIAPLAERFIVYDHSVVPR